MSRINASTTTTYDPMTIEPVSPQEALDAAISDATQGWTGDSSVDVNEVIIGLIVRGFVVAESVSLDRMRDVLEAIYDDARYRFDGNHGTTGSEFTAGQCRWCGAPPPDEAHDHDVACPAAKAGYALGKL